MNQVVDSQDLNIVKNAVNIENGEIKTTPKKQNCCIASIINTKRMFKSYWYFYMSFITSPFVVFAYESVITLYFYRHFAVFYYIN